jgi:hypothetical protein
VDAAIDLNDQPRPVVHEIDNIRPDWRLASEMKAFEPTNKLPQLSLCIRRVTPQPVRGVLCSLAGLDRPWRSC